MASSLLEMDNQPLGVRSASVGEPRTIGEGVRAHVQYTVRVELLQLCAGLTGLTFAVPRRFSDFAWLRDRLRDAYPWLIVPALPEKSALNKTQLLATGKKDDEFQDMRLRALQRWLERVAMHPQLSGTGECAWPASCLLLPLSSFSSPGPPSPRPALPPPPRPSPHPRSLHPRHSLISPHALSGL